MANPENAGKRLTRQLQQTIREFELLAPGDRVMVALSGGKDSYTLFDLLLQLRPVLPECELIGVHLDQQQPGYDGAPLVAWLRERGAPFEILCEDTYSVVKERVPEGSTYCSMCSRLRRGILYTAAERLGCNKIALGHHRDDAIETLLMNLFFSGRLQAMPARYRTDDGRFEVIRPLIECDEQSIVQYAERRAFPILPCNLCGSQSGLQREEMAKLITTLEARHPDLRSVMLHALKNVSPTHLLDQRLVRLDAQPGHDGKAAPAHSAAARSHRALPILRG
ncbi:MAG: tRNA 2-thiocytidine(32) synthetase TtcA [Polyangiaceae bacterium]|nr:tRNA 2-thiocytidine(32) synthetase TtcA [Myxococcales bacterium]MCB9586587.1 tRNA 2-thiocytidine(32) synthetase TtcA [Polyangiaceae bacterium]MCB9606094.1 tRNA 2-thiocytidine(32) synthetase TtcA [Polyangiaceae bacterium]